MKIINNDKLIARNKKISRIILFSSLGLLAAGFFWSLSNPDSVSGNKFSYLILVPSYILVQISIYLSNRWGREPRPDQIIEASLKGLENKYSLINYYSGVPHLLIGPAGIKIINPFHQSGVITYNQKKNRFIQKGGANFLAKTFGQESIPNIINNTSRLEKDLFSFFKKNNIQTQIPVRVINIFHSEKAEIHENNSPVSVIHASKLKDTIRKEAKLVKINQNDIDKLIEDISKIFVLA